MFQPHQYTSSLCYVPLLLRVVVGVYSWGLSAFLVPTFNTVNGILFNVRGRCTFFLVFEFLGWDAACGTTE